MSKQIKRRRTRTITHTFRIQQEWDDVLVEEAERQGISVNLLVNKIFRKYALFTRWVDNAGFQSFSPQMFKGILEELSPDSLAKLGTTSGASDVIDILSIMGRPLNYESCIELLAEYFGGSDFFRWFNCFHHVLGNQHVFHLQHNLGRKWSIYLKAYLLAALRSFTNIEVEARIYDFALNLSLVSRTKPKGFLKD
ncbi:MAG: hypothetical protein NWE83_12815 [Candidatus Bathyarchaeota archaeon]|nr:hypothetical protein [Candidatus Bathyarchaeota archaeon]